MAKNPWELPEEMVVRLPYGYRVVIQKRRIGPHHGEWQDFGDVNKTGYIRIRRQDSYDEQLDTLIHEMFHALTDWSGRIRFLENEFRAHAEGDKDD